MTITGNSRRNIVSMCGWTCVLVGAAASLAVRGEELSDVRAKSFTLVGSDGQVAARLLTRGDGARLELGRPGSGAPAIVITTGRENLDDDPRIELFDGDGGEAMMLGWLAPGTLGLRCGSLEDRYGFNLYGSQDGFSGIAAWGYPYSIMLSVPSNDGESANIPVRLDLLHADGTVEESLVVGPDGNIEHVDSK